ncbi:MAG: VWA domain-containing protein, partial [Burkholderiales bacterium]
TRRGERSFRAGRIDWRGTLQTMARHGGELGELRWRRPRPLPAPMVVLADISGSMSRYSRMLLHFAHALGHAEARVESFVFGTRLTRTTRLLKSRDPDVAVAQVVRAVEDWSGGTRITTCLHEFNQRWARRALSSRTTVLLISDGLEHGDTLALSHEMERLAKSCRRLIWLNPLLRFDRFQPKAAGIRAMLPHVDRFLPVHNLDSLEELVRLLGQPDTPQRWH